MRYKEIIEAARRSYDPRFRGQEIHTTMDPEVLSLLSQKAQYDREKAKLSPKPTRTDDTEYVSIYGTKIPQEDIEHYANTGDLDWALSRSKRFQTQSMPPELTAKLFADPRWQAIIKRFWDIAVDVLADKIHNAQLEPGEPRRITHKQIEQAAPMRDLAKLMSRYQDKFGIDRKGRRLPPNL